MATFETASSTPTPPAGGEEAAVVAAVGVRSETIESIHETRLTGFCVHALVLGSLALLPQLAKIPMAVVSGIFLYLGRKVWCDECARRTAKDAILLLTLPSPPWVPSVNVSVPRPRLKSALRAATFVHLSV